MDSLTIDGLRLESVRLAVENHRDMETWRRAVAFAAWAQSSAPWWLGDSLVLGESRFGDAVIDLYPPTTNIQAVERYAATCRRVDPRHRVPGLSMAHHEAVSRLAAIDQRRMLAKAIQDRLSSDELRRAVAAEWRGG